MSQRLNSREDGIGIYTDRESGKILAIITTMHCCHCGGHFKVIPGSGRMRGWCQNCNQTTCGKDACDPCVHWEQKLENIEADRDLYFKPVRVLVPDGFNLGADDGKDVQAEERQVACPGSYQSASIADG